NSNGNGCKRNDRYSTGQHLGQSAYTCSNYQWTDDWKLRQCGHVYCDWIRRDYTVHICVGGNRRESSFRLGRKLLHHLQHRRNLHRFGDDHRCQCEHVYCFTERDSSSSSNYRKLHSLNQPNNWCSSYLRCICFGRHWWILVRLESWRRQHRNRKPSVAQIHNCRVIYSGTDSYGLKHDPDNPHADHNSLAVSPCAPLDQLYNEFGIRSGRTISNLPGNSKRRDFSVPLFVEFWRLVSLDWKPGLSQFHNGELHCYSDGYRQFGPQRNGNCLPNHHNHNKTAYTGCSCFSDCQRRLSTHFQRLSDRRSLADNQSYMRHLPCHRTNFHPEWRPRFCVRELHLDTI